jgi:hypothetical protein
LNSRPCFLRELPIGSSSFWSLATPSWVSTFSGQHQVQRARGDQLQAAVYLLVVLPEVVHGLPDRCWCC